MLETKLGPANEVAMFDGSIEIKSMDQNPEPAKAVMCAVTLHCSGSATGFGRAIAAAARAFIDSLPAEHRERAGANMLDGFFETLYSATEVRHGGLHS